MADVKTDDATEIALMAVDRFVFLRVSMEEAAMKLRMGFPSDALDILQKALAETDVGKMKVWREGEQPL